MSTYSWFILTLLGSWISLITWLQVDSHTIYIQKSDIRSSDKVGYSHGSMDSSSTWDWIRFCNMCVRRWDPWDIESMSWYSMWIPLYIQEDWVQGTSPRVILAHYIQRNQGICKKVWQLPVHGKTSVIIWDAITTTVHIGTLWSMVLGLCRDN